MESSLAPKLMKSNNTNYGTNYPPKAKRISISIFVISLPFLYVSLLHVPPSTLFQDTAFWFLISNSIIIIVATHDSTFFFSAPPRDATGHDQLYEDFIKHSKAKDFVLVDNEMKASPKAIEKEMISSKDQIEYDRSQSDVVAKNQVNNVAAKELVRRSLSDKRINKCRGEESEYWKMSNEELNRRAEEFIRRFNREIRLQEMRRDCIEKKS